MVVVVFSVVLMMLVVEVFVVVNVVAYMTLRAASKSGR